MQTAVEIALILGTPPFLANLRDIWVRAKVDQQAKQDRQDRLEKERMDREQQADLAALAAVPGFMTLFEEDDKHREAKELSSLRQEVAELKKKLENANSPHS